MKIKISVFLLLFTVILTSCFLKENKRDHERIVQLLDNFIEKSDTAHRLKYDTNIFHFDILTEEINKNNIHTSLIYVLDSECSMCFVNFFDFLFHFQKIKKMIPIIVIVEEGNKEIFNYYLEQIQFSSKIDLHCMVNIDKKFIERKINSYNGMIFYLYNGNIINSLSYMPLLQHKLD